MLASPTIATFARTLRGRFVSSAAAGVAAHVLVAAWVFGPALFGGRMLYLRDISTYFYPNLVFLARSLASGVFPLWNPAVDAGSPFLLVYPPDVVLAAFLGPRGALALGPALHMLLASVGATALARHLGIGPLAAWTCGLVFGLSGFMVSAVNLVPLHQAAAWAPLVVLLARKVAAQPTPKGAVLFAGALALQVSTLAGEIVLQTGMAFAFLAWRSLDRRALAALGASGVLALLLSAPAWMGLASVLEGTRRGAGFSAAEAVSGSLTPIELAGLVLPRFFGDMHTFTNEGYWGQQFLLGGFPYLLSVYLGAAVLALALAAGRDRLWLLVALGILLALGAHGPFAGILGSVRYSRNPVKFLFLASLGVALLAGRGLDRGRLRQVSWPPMVPGVLVTLFAAALWLAPARAAALLANWPLLDDPAARLVFRVAWPSAFLSAGVIALFAGAAAARGGTLAAGAAALAVLDLLMVNGAENRFATADFYALRANVRGLVDHVPRDGQSRVFGYGIGNTQGLGYAPSLRRENADVWLYYLDRQVLYGRAPVLDGLEGALDEDRTAWAPAGSTLGPRESTPPLFAAVYPRLRLANVRWVLSFAPLPDELVAERGRVVLPEVLQPLRLWELRDPLPRAWWVPARHVVPARVVARGLVRAGAFDPRAVVLLDPESPVVAPPSAPPSAPAPSASVRADAEGPHEIRLHARTPPGYVVLASGWDAGWQAEDASGTAVPVLRANDRYIALPTPGGDRVFRLRYRPRWWRWSLLCSALGVGAAAALLALGRRIRPRTADDGGGEAPAPR